MLCGPPPRLTSSRPAPPSPASSITTTTCACTAPSATSPRTISSTAGDPRSGLRGTSSSRLHAKPDMTDERHGGPKPHEQALPRISGKFSTCRPVHGEPVHRGPASRSPVPNRCYLHADAGSRILLLSIYTSREILDRESQASLPSRNPVRRLAQGVVGVLLASSRPISPAHVNHYLRRRVVRNVMCVR